MMDFTFYKQQDTSDCGPSCLRMIARFYGKSYTLRQLRDKTQMGRSGTSLLGLSQGAEHIGFHTLSAKLDFKTLKVDVPLPCIVHWQQNHFVVVYKITLKEVYVADPAKNLLKYSHEEFCQSWLSDKSSGIAEGIALLLEPTPNFFLEKEDEPTQSMGFRRILVYLTNYKKLFIQLFLGLVGGSLLQLILPFLTQSIIDVGIQSRNIDFINLILVAQLALSTGRIAIEFVRSWLLLYISARISLNILSDFFDKLMRQPLAFFDMKMLGDILQRIGDHDRIQEFLTSTSINVLFSLFNLLIFGSVLAYYNLSAFTVFIVGSFIYICWVLLFLRQRRNLDYKRFSLSSKSQAQTIQIIQGMQDIKLANAEMPMRWEWERIQARWFKLSLKSLALEQWQQAGAFLINESKNILLTFFAAKAVINGNLTIGEMMAMQYITGQLNGPVEQLVQFVQSFQDARISLERLNEIHENPDEEIRGNTYVQDLPINKNIVIKDLSFNYPGIDQPVLTGINLVIPEGKTTAIIGTSGSGKTTLLKLLLKFYQPSHGEIMIGDVEMSKLSFKSWRNNCGTVLQDGFLFSDTIARNVAIGEEDIDVDKLMHAVTVANILEFIESLPLGFNTMIGAEGNGLSQGQRQRILIARAVYKSPKFIFFDEATNALDAKNEKIIVHNLEKYFINRTVVVVAHRLSTVKNANNIVVLEKGKIVEQGTHLDLIKQGGKYYDLVYDQLELGN